MQLALEISLWICIVAAGFLMGFIAVVDVRQRLIYLWALFFLVVIRIGAAVVSYMLMPDGGLDSFNNGQTISPDWLHAYESGLAQVEGQNSYGEDFLRFCAQLSFSSLAVSCVSAIGVMLFLKGFEIVTDAVVSQIRRKGVQAQKRTVLGLGDILLTGVCCLYLVPFQLEVFLLAVALGGVVCAGLVYLARKDTTFPFAPAIIAGCIVAFLC